MTGNGADPSAGPAAIEAIGLTVGYRTGRRRTTTVLEGVSASVQRGRLVCLLGPNGAGKSTLLRTLVGSQAPLAGSVRVAGDDLHRLSARERAQRLSVVLTDRVDVGMMTARALVGLGRAPRVGWFASTGDDDHEVVARALDAAGATALAERQVVELSDGERQRVMIARALAQEPSVLVLDEPTAFLDLTRRIELVAVLRRLVRDTGLAVVLSTHDLDLALRTADALWLVQPDGTFAVGAPEDLALEGRLAATYAGSEVRFDHASGTFEVNGVVGGPSVAVVGSEPHRTWIERAARRADWQPVASPDATWCLDVSGTAPVGWSLRQADRLVGAGEGADALVRLLRTVRNLDQTTYKERSIS